ncbi:YdcF family protein [Flaviflagellibacter deserti]|uniref:YdcF family protein n=1 Tax=Flaviflagellibacter deserti TaxID=2267266 RepID=A0ABV9Z264_9HYPH
MTGEEGTGTKPRPPSLLKRLVQIAVIVGSIGALALVGGFIAFVATIPRDEPAANVSGDGIVVLTGGAERIAEATELLAEGRARRLLISGVDPQTTGAEIVRIYPRAKRWLDCCVDLGRRALNTAGNAVETREWIRRHGFQTVIVVTSGWHMRRSLLELQRVIPEAILLPYPVITGNAGSETWWGEPANFRLLATEYVKYLAALIQVRVAPRIADDEPKKS